MAYLFFSETYETLYNCSFYNYKSKPYEDRSYPFYGWLLIVTFAIIWMLYIPCIIVMCKKDLLKNSCYKLMVYLAFCDLHTSFYIGLYAGYISISGNVFCHWPRLAFWMGCLNGMAWKMQSTAIILLAFNRCVEAFDEHWSRILFQGKRVFLWMALPFLWGSRDIIWGPPGLYSPIISLLVYNPHIGYFEDYKNTYSDTLVFPNNIFVVSSIILIYGTFCFLIYMKSRNLQNFGKHTVVFGQILFIASFLFMIASGFLVTQFIKLPIWINPWLQYTFLLFDGQPAIIYLTMNSSMRAKVFQLIGIKKNSDNTLFKISKKTNSVTATANYG